MLSPAKPVRKIIVWLWLLLLVLLSLAVRFQWLDTKVLDSGVSFVVQTTVGPKLRQLLNLVAIFNHWWVVMLANLVFSFTLRRRHYPIAANFYLISWIGLFVLAGLWSLAIRLILLSGPFLAGTFPDLILLFWYYLFLNFNTVLFYRVVKRSITCCLIVIIEVLIWVLLLLLRIQLNNVLCSAGVAALFAGVCWWAVMGRLYARHANHWQHLFKIDGRI